MWRRRAGSESRTGLELLVIHRPSYDDWTFPKGKLDGDESRQEAAVREIWEETGVRVRLGLPLPQVQYRVASGRKLVDYWMARPLDDSSDFTPNREVDEVRWVRPREAGDLLSYTHDRSLLEAFRAARTEDLHRTRTLVVLRHAKAQAREAFDGDDVDRPLQPAGRAQAKAVARLIASYGVEQVVSSPAVRCVQTVAPFASTHRLDVETEPWLSEETTRRHVGRTVSDLIDAKRPVVLCSHRPTLPWVFESLGLDPVELAPGHGVVVHHRKGRVHATELI